MRARPETTERATAYQDALGRLSRRDHSEQELRRHLLRRGHEAAEVESTLIRLRERHLVDDPRFAARFAQSRMEHRGLGRHRIRAALRQRGVEPAAIEGGLREALAEVSEGEALDAQARRYWSARAAEEPRRRLQKLWGFLLRRGFPGSLVADHLRVLWPEWSEALEGMDLDAAAQDPYEGAREPVSRGQRDAPAAGKEGERKS